MQDNYFCENCGVSNQSKLIKNSEDNFGCPRCHSKFSFSNGIMIRTAQFGGSMPKPNMFGPGSSPLFKNTSNRSRGINIKFESSLDAVMSTTHRPAPIDPERNLEKRLEIFHTQHEEDNIPYNLSSKERFKLKQLKEIRRREKFYEDAAKRELENSVEYIKKNSEPAEEVMKTLEESLSSRRKYEGHREQSIAKDESPEQIKPERRHTVAGKHGITIPFSSPVSDSDADENDFADNNYNENYLTDFLAKGAYDAENLTNKQVDEDLRQEAKGLADYLGAGKDTNVFNFPMPDEGPGSNAQAFNLPSPLKNYFNPGDTTIEEGLNGLMKSKSEPAPQLTGPDVNIEEWLGKGPKGVFENYNIPASGVLGLTPMPKNRLK
jgi:hypothetical protein